MEPCTWCGKDVGDLPSRIVQGNGRSLILHTTCFEEFTLLVQETIRITGSPPVASTGLDRLVRSIGNRKVLVHRGFPNEQLPALALLGTLQDPIAVADVYSWLAENEVKIKNPANQILRLREKGLVATFDQDGQRTVVITDGGRRLLLEYVKSLELSSAPNGPSS